MPQRGPLVLDAGPLLTYLCLRFLDEIKAPPWQRDEYLRGVQPGDYGWDANQQDRFLQFLGAHPQRLTTSCVLTEVFSLREHSALARRAEPFRRSAFRSLSSIEERPALLLHLDPELVVRYGITDASVVWLAQRERAMLLTDDQELYGALPSDPQFSIVLTEHCL